MSCANIMKPLLLVTVTVTMLLSTIAKETSAPMPMESLQDILVYAVEPPSNIRKRDTAYEKRPMNEDFTKFIERKLIQHGRALEHLIQVAQTNEELTKKLINNFGEHIPEPKMPERLQLTSRRSMDGRQVSVPAIRPPQEISPWCPVAMVCRRTLDPVCGYDDNFGYGKFDDICHMLQVNCYWKYNFGLVAHCRPILN